MLSIFAIVIINVSFLCIFSFHIIPVKNYRSISQLCSTTQCIEDEVVEAWRKGYQTCKAEVCKNIIDAGIPLDLEGTYYKNGHAKFEAGKEQYLHPFDGDGMIVSISFHNGSALFRNRFVRTKGYLKEKKTKKVSFRNCFGTQREGMLSNIFDTKLKNVANTNVMYWGKKLLALWEGGLPYRLEPDSLRTLGDYTFRGLLKKNDVMSAHPRVDKKNNRLINFSAKMQSSSTKLVIYEFDQDLKLLQQRKVEIPGFSFFHDFIVTENYYIFDQSPVKFDPLPFILGQRGPSDCISKDDGKQSLVYLIPRNLEKPIEIVPVDSHFNFHFANAYEASNTSVVFDVVWTENMTLGTTYGAKKPIWETIDYKNTVPYSTLTRYTLNYANEQWEYHRQRLSDCSLDFPSININNSCQKHRYTYASAGLSLKTSTPYNGLIKIDCDLKTEKKWYGLPYELIGETIVANKKKGTSDLILDEDDVYLISLIHNTKDLFTELVIFDGKKVEFGPISRTKLPVFIPLGLHGTYVNDLVFNPEEVQSRWTACNAIESKSWNQMTGGFSGLGITYDMFD